MMNHEKVFKLAKADDEFRRAVVDSGQRFPSFSFDTLEKGVWASGYAGWILGRYGAEEYKRRADYWRTL